MTHSGSGVELLGRRQECRALDDLLTGVRARTGAALVLRGEAGIGKTALLQHAGAGAGGCRVLRVTGVESEMELSYAGLHQLCAPLLAGLETLPEPQRQALATAFGQQAGGVPDRFMVGLATLSLLAQAGDEQPLVCLIDDLQWLDQVSALTLAFVARRLLAEAVLLLFAVREPMSPDIVADLPQLTLRGLPDGASSQLLESIVPGRMDDRVRRRILKEAAGNPLALLELPRELTPPEPVSGLITVRSGTVPSRVEADYLSRVRALSEEDRRLLLTAAADPSGDVALLRRAAQRLRIDVDAALSEGNLNGLILIDEQVHFRHPLMRSAAYRAATDSERLEARRALADSIDVETDPDRRAWHRAQATTLPDEDVALDLVHSAGRAQERGGIAATAAFLERATALTPDPARRSQRALEAAQATLLSGAFESAAALVAMAEVRPTDDLGHARTDLLRSQIAFVRNRGNEATPLLLSAARRLEQVDITLARQTYVDAIAAALFASHLADGTGLLEAGAAARAAPPAPTTPLLADRLLDALALRLTDGYVTAVPAMAEVLEELCREDLSVQDTLRWLLFGSVLASDLWDLDRWRATTTRHVTVIREAGALSELPTAIDALATVHLFSGELAAAAALIDEARVVCEVIGSPQARLSPLGLAVFSGEQRKARTLIDDLMKAAAAQGQGASVMIAHWYDAVLCNSLGQYAQALVAARPVVDHPEAFSAPRWCLVELVEAAARSGDTASASTAVESLSEILRATGTDWALGVEARSRALVSQGSDAEDHYQQAIELLSRTRAQTCLGRAHLVYGEWLRRENRRIDAREQLGIAYDTLSDLGVEGFAQRARRELRATGAVVHPRTIRAATALTAQEEQIARLAGEGLTNPEIGARLFLSPHTVDWHLRKVFSKLGISSRREIPRQMAQPAVGV